MLDYEPRNKHTPTLAAAPLAPPLVPLPSRAHPQESRADPTPQLERRHPHRT